jgi:hypothetical protein
VGEGEHASFVALRVMPLNVVIVDHVVPASDDESMYVACDKGARWV